MINGTFLKRITGAIFTAAILGSAINVYGAAANVKVSRFWHNHQPIYWPEWNAAPEDQRVQFAEDSEDLKGGQGYDSSTLHPENDLNSIFGWDDRRNAYQAGPRNSLALVNTDGGYSMSYSGSLMDNVNSYGEAGENGYGSGWWDGNREASSWTTTGGGAPRLDLLGFTHHHSLGPLLPKEVFRKEIQVFKQAWWKAWNKNSDLSDHSKGFFPTEMAFSRHLTDVLVDEGYEWVLVASHHLSRTSPNYLDNADPEGSYNIFSNPPNKADRLGPNESSGWWFGTGNVGETAWNLSPFAYQLHKAQYIDPETGVEKNIIMVPSDDIMSYRYGYANEGTGKISSFIDPFCNDGTKPCIVIPSTDGDNAWGGGSSSWNEAAPQYMNNGTYGPVAIQDFVDDHGGNADVVHVEDGAWIFPETCYGSPQFLKWIEPPPKPGSPSVVPNTQIDLETPGFATKFYSWAPLIAGANWCITAEQMIDESVDAWKIHDPYDNLGSDTWLSPNVVERAWHIYLAGLDSGFNYYGGLGNDDEIKTSMATRRAVELLDTFVNGQKATNDFTAPTVLKPQRFPYNPGWWTFGWFNSVPGGDTSFLKKMDSEFYVWTHAYDVSGITSIVVKLRKDNDGVNSMGSNHNETYAGGSDVGSWTSLPMNKHTFPTTGAELTALANNGQLEYFDQGLSPEVADYYWVKITESNLAGFRGQLLDYYIEAYDSRGNRHRSEIQHVWVEDDGNGGPPPSDVSFSEDPRDCAALTVTYISNSGPLSGEGAVKMWLSFNEGGSFTDYAMTNIGSGNHEYTVDTIPDNAPSATVYFQNDGETITDNRNGQNWSTVIRDCDAPVGPSTVTFTNAPACDPVTLDYRPNGHPLQTATQVFAHIGFDEYSIVWPGQVMTKVTNNLWRLIITPTTDVTQIDVVFNNGGGTWDNNAGADWAFPLNVCAGPEPLTGFYISNPSNDITVGNATANYIMNGVGESIAGVITWTNDLTGGSGTAFAGIEWQINSIPLGVGSNVITVTGTNVGSLVVTTAHDTAESYHPSGWTNGASLGTGWGGGWELNAFDTAGHFTATPGDNPNLNISAYAFGLWSQTGSLSEAIRPFAAPLTSGQVFRARIDNNYIQEGQQGVGVALRNTAGDSLIQFYFNGGDAEYTVEDADAGRDSGIGWTDQGLTVQITILSDTNYRMNVGSQEIFGAYDGSLDQVRFWNYSGGVGSDYDFFFDAPTLFDPASGSGIVTSDTVTIVREAADDSNGDGIPDSWYNKYGMNPSTPGLATNNADGDVLLNWEEYVFDTDPTNAASFNGDTIMAANGGGELDLRVESPTSTGRWYDIFWATSLINGTWSPMGLNVPGDPTNGPVTLTVSNTVPVRYYRTGAKLPTP